MRRAIIHTATGEFRDEQGRCLIEGRSQGWTAAGSTAPLDAAFSIVQIPDGVDLDSRTQKWNGSAVVSKTAAELTATVNAEKDARATQADTDLLIQAVATLDYEERQKLQVKAGQTLLTAAQCKARVKAIYRNLL